VKQKTQMADTNKVEAALGIYIFQSSYSIIIIIIIIIITPFVACSTYIIWIMEPL
jgi:flagellar basal body-associated protein FliL